MGGGYVGKGRWHFVYNFDLIRESHIGRFFPLIVEGETSCAEAVTYLSDSEELHLENKRGVGRDHAASSPSSVAVIGRDGQTCLLA